MGHASRPKHVLCYGHDTVLLQSRRGILKQAGCPTEIAGDDRGFRTSLLGGCPGVLILCQSLSVEESLQAAGLALEHCPRTPLLLMYVQRQKLFPSQTFQFMQTMEGPKAFAEKVFRMLYRPGEQSPTALLD